VSGGHQDAVRIAGAIIGMGRALNVRLREMPEGTGLALAELNVLGGIEKGYDLSSTLARRLMLDAPRVSRIVDGFVASGYITRDPDMEDRRRTRLRLTPSGAEYLARGRAELALALEDLLGGLTEEERAGLETAVPGIRRVLARGAAIDAYADADIAGDEDIPAQAGTSSR
jgi:DNA-binding MarR family transcriptional regulator